MAPQMGSAGSIAASVGRRQTKRTTSAPRKETALTRKVTAGPEAATTRPARAGPAARAMLKPMLPRVTAAGRSSRGTISGMLACQAGPFKAAPSPSRKVKPRRIQGVVAPAAVNAQRPKAATVIQVWVTRSSRRRSSTSATAPAGRDSRNIGRLVAAWTRATSVGDGVSVVIIHDAPTFWNHVPTLEATLAIHSQRNTVWRSGLQVERTEIASAVATPATLRTPRMLVEITGRGGEERLSLLDQLRNDIRSDRILNPVVGHQSNLESL